MKKNLKAKKPDSEKTSKTKLDQADALLKEKAKTDKKTFSKEEVKAIKDKAKGVDRSQGESLKCAVCDNPILKGQAFKTLVADEKHGRRHYHQATCSPGSPNWKKFRGESHSEKVPAKAPKKSPKAEEVKPVVKETESKGTKETKPKDGVPYREGTQIHFIYSCVQKNMNTEQMVPAFVKAFPDRKGSDPKFFVVWYISKIRRDGHKIAKNADGSYGLQ